MIACMGGWCRQRDRCAHYYAQSTKPAERLCNKGEDKPQPVKIERKPSEQVRAA